MQRHLAILRGDGEFYQKLLSALEIMNKEQQTRLVSSDIEVDAQLYDGFVPDGDKTTMRAVRAAEPTQLSEFADKLQDKRLQSLLPLYKARNFPSALTDEERGVWEEFRTRRLVGGGGNSRLRRYMRRLAELAESPRVSAEKRFLLEELQLYAESIMPLPE
nr:hypothetical protein [Candidatus Saccharibacteria bacterium]